MCWRTWGSHHGGRFALRLAGSQHRFHIDPQALQRDDDLLAQFAGTERHGTQGSRGKRGADLHTILLGKSL